MSPDRPTTNADRIRRPSSVRIGMFCRFGSVEESRPVAAIVCMYVVWMRPSSAIDFNSPSTVTRSRAASRCRSSASRNGCSVLPYRSARASASVVYPVLVRLVFGMPSLSNRITCSCFGEPRLTLSSADGRRTRPPAPAPPCPRSATPAPRSASASTAIPTRSIRASTSTSGSSTSRSSPVPPVSLQLSVQRRRQLEHRPGPQHRILRGCVALGRRSRASPARTARRPRVSSRLQVAHHEVGQVVGALVRPHQVGGQRRVVHEPGRRVAPRHQRLQRPLRVVQRLRAGGVCQPRRQRRVVGRVEGRHLDVGRLVRRPRSLRRPRLRSPAPTTRPRARPRASPPARAPPATTAALRAPAPRPAPPRPRRPRAPRSSASRTTGRAAPGTPARRRPGAPRRGPSSAAPGPPTATGSSTSSHQPVEPPVAQHGVEVVAQRLARPCP